MSGIPEPFSVSSRKFESNASCAIRFHPFSLSGCLTSRRSFDRRCRRPDLQLILCLVHHGQPEAPLVERPHLKLGPQEQDDPEAQHQRHPGRHHHPGGQLVQSLLPLAFALDSSTFFANRVPNSK